MRKKKLSAICAALMALCMVLAGCAAVGGGSDQQEAKDSKEAMDHFLADIQSGNYEAASTYLLEGNRLFRMFAAKDGESVPMLDSVYKKAMSQMGDFTYTLEQGPVPDSITVKLQGKDCHASIGEAMSMAIQSQAQNGGSDFVDIAGWLTTGLENAEPIEEQEYHCVMTKKNDSYHMGHTSYGDIDLINAITGGFYDYTKLTMTTCTGSQDGVEYVDHIAALGDTVIGYMETMTEKLDQELTDEEKDMIYQAYFSAVEGLDGVYVGIQFNNDGTMTTAMGIDFNKASSTALANAGIVSGKYISNGTSNLSLSATVKAFQESGMTCETVPQYDDASSK